MVFVLLHLGLFVSLSLGEKDWGTKDKSTKLHKLSVLFYTKLVSLIRGIWRGTWYLMLRIR
jgi:hypothetical protein